MKKIFILLILTLSATSALAIDERVFYGISKTLDSELSTSRHEAAVPAIRRAKKEAIATCEDAVGRECEIIIVKTTCERLPIKCPNVELVSTGKRVPTAACRLKAFFSSIKKCTSMASAREKYVREDNFNK